MTQAQGTKINSSGILPENTVTTDRVTIEQARDYEQRRFTRESRKRKLNKFEKDFARYLFNMVGSDSHILDVPCGNGRFYDIFAGAKKLTMIDYSENMLTAIKEKIGDAKNVEFVKADITNLPLEDNCAELCFCMRLFHHMKTDDVRLKALSELTRISKKYVALSFYNKTCLRYILRKTFGKKIRGNYITFGHIIEMAKQIGLVPIARFPKVNFIEQQCLVVFRKVQHK